MLSNKPINAANAVDVMGPEVDIDVLQLGRALRMLPGSNNVLVARRAQANMASGS